MTVVAEPSLARLTLREYELSRELGIRIDADAEFYALIALLMRRADSENLNRLRACWPNVHADLQARYDAPGGRLEGDPT